MSDFSIKPAVPLSKTLPWLFSTDTPLAFQIDAAAHTLAAQIESGEFSELLPEQRTELRHLALTMAAWSTGVHSLEIERASRGLKPYQPGLIARLFLRLL